MKISIVGAGYVGLVTAACLVEKGNHAIVVDMDELKIEAIVQKISPIYENGLQKLLDSHMGKRLNATTDLMKAIIDSEITIIAVGTPFNGKSIDLSYVSNAAVQIGKVLGTIKRYHVVVVKSTVIPGTTDELVLPLLEKNSKKKPGVDFGLAMNPEFLREGNAVYDFMKPDRIVIGGIDDRSVNTVKQMYNRFSAVDYLLTNPKTAEMIKYAANSFLATTISFSNEIANLCSEIPGVDVKQVMKGVHLDRRLSPMMEHGGRINPEINTFLEAGCGFGGSCFPKDVKALISYGFEKQAPMKILKAVIEVNSKQPKRLIDALYRQWPEIKGLKVSVLGLAFKPGTDDIRESPAIQVLKDLVEGGAKITAYDPKANENMKRLFTEGLINFTENVNNAILYSDAIILITAWEEFNKIPQIIKGMERQPLMIDGRRLLNHHDFDNYVGIGLGKYE